MSFVIYQSIVSIKCLLFAGASGGSPFKLSGFFIIIGLAFLAPVGVGIIGYFQQKNRGKSFAEFAAQNGWGYTDTDQANWEFDDAQRYRLFTLGRGLGNELYSIAFRDIQGGKMFLFDYYFERGSSSMPINVNTTCLCLDSADFNFPYFSLYKETTWGILGEYLGTADIDFPAHPNFSSRYKLAGENVAWIRQFFTPQLLSYLETLTDICIDAGGEKIFIYRVGQLEPVENLYHFVNDKINIFNNICQYAYYSIK